MIAIGIRLLAGRLVATHPADRRRAEWPPHPDRLFMALVAAWGASDRAEQEADALRWLESLGAPEIIASSESDDAASEVARREVVTAYVPVNDTELPGRASRTPPTPARVAAGLAVLPEKRSRQARHFPAITPRDECVLFRWRATPAESCASALAALCRRVTYLGHSSSPVQCWLDPAAGTLVPPTLVPTASHAGSVRLRVPASGRFDDLEARFSAGLRPSAAGWTAYGPPRSECAPTTATSTCFDPRLVVLRQTGGRRFGLSSTQLLTRALRDALMSRFTAVHGLAAPEWLSGHAADGRRSEEDHVACFPLPHVGHAHADGQILGLGLALPRRLSDDEIDRVFHGVIYATDPLAAPAELHLTFGREGDLTLELDDRPARPVALRPETWTADLDARPAFRWATVTPIAFDRHPRGADPWPEIEAAIRAATRRIGLADCLDSVELTPVSLFAGAPTNRGFPNLQRKAGGNIHHSHAVLTFCTPIVGPLLLGAGRYRGYGLCRPLRSAEPTV